MMFLEKAPSEELRAEGGENVEGGGSARAERSSKRKKKLESGVVVLAHARNKERRSKNLKHSK